MADFVRVANDLAHSFYTVLTDENGPVDLPEGTTVTFVSRLLGALLPTTVATARVVAPGAPSNDPNRGVVRYDPVLGDVVQPGIYFLKWQVNTPDQPPGYNQSFPEDGAEVLILLAA